MSVRCVVGTCVIALASGCYMDLSMGVQRAGGGATGFGWELALSGGVAYDIGGVVKPSIGVGASMARHSVEGGRFGTTGLAYHGRLDVAISGTEHLNPEDMIAQAGVGIPEGGADAKTRITLDYGLGKYEELLFEVPGTEMKYTRKATTHRMYLGIAREYDVGGVQASFGIGPNVTLMPNDFVGDTTAIGVQFHSSFWFIPVFKSRPSGSMMDTYSGPGEPIKQGPVVDPNPKDCIDKYGTRRPC